MFHHAIDMTSISYIVGLYLTMCAVVIAVVRVSIPPGTMRQTFLFVGCTAPFFAVYIAYRALISKTEISQDEKEQFARIAEQIEQRRLEKFGGIKLPERIRSEYIRTLNRTAKNIERRVDKAAA
jgi:hypothetical protein